mmetsp:Transcript_6662/g.10994  ORF Transcript_6662/g.10994 Transcript_6662/m.10994 type:complete len:520 (-) Transcript_6662:241-1800(-)|eukprot:CAMPEP_0119030898 /NCGR_PEP_ID=MMETSP1176-20130426/41264_1 /TAXON_ID=265551 /ORGANISM="Synedropsis recta cf, Strain CCMP1620" /LENGTH=519 /DNA_ID=CAMNT_0006987277 /DNA_START=28 /DNA_END=1587 /DNA_ORIENTATION=+
MLNAKEIYVRARVGVKRGTFLWPSLLLVVAILSVLTLSVVDAESAESDSDEVSLAKLSGFITLATSYLVRVSHTEHQDPQNTGKFTYIAYLDEDLPLDFTHHKQKAYNLLRHNGAIYSMALSYGRNPDEEVLEAIERSVAYLKREAIGPVPDVSAAEDVMDDQNHWQDLPTIPNLLAAWETKGMTGDQDSAKAKLGGAGLALIALVSMEQITPGVSDMTYLRSLGEFIKYMQHEDGSFTCRYIPSEGGREDGWTSLYYPGEAALGLVYLSSMETDEVLKQKWINVAAKAIMYLESIRRTQELTEIESDHWALLATRQLLPLLDQKSKEYWLVYDHGVRVVKAMMAGHSKQELKEESKGCFTFDGRTCPTATRMEGLIAALSFVRPSEMFASDREDHAETLLDRMHHDIKLGISFLIESQDTSTMHNMHGGVPVRYPSANSKAMEVRVDYVQHSMSAMIAYENLLKKSSAKGRMLGGLSRVTTGSMYGEQWILVGMLVAAIAVVVLLTTKKREKKRSKHV